MKSRVLPKDEWFRLPTDEATSLAAGLPEGDIQVVVVEKGEEIVASVILFRALHWEGTWIAEGHRTAGTTRRLLLAVERAATDWGQTWAFTGAAEEHVAKIIERLGGKKVEMDTFVIGFGQGRPAKRTEEVVTCP